LTQVGRIEHQSAYLKLRSADSEFFHPQSKGTWLYRHSMSRLMADLQVFV
jgi:hypothetical protein